MNVAVLGAGVSGIAAAYRLKENGVKTVVYEAGPDWGGLCRSFEVDGFRFDSFGHVSFDGSTRVWLENRTKHLMHESRALNYDAGRWLKHPVQEHLSGLPIEERVDIILSFVARDMNIEDANNYGQWLKQTYGVVFAEKYPYRYTRKYWTVEPLQLETKWVFGRMEAITLAQMLRGAMDDSLEATHYSGTIAYPKTGGFQAFLSPLAEQIDIRTGKRAVFIDPNNRKIRFSDGETAEYDRLISTIPLPELCSLLRDMPDSVRDAAKRLNYTSGVTVSVGLAKERVAPAAWFYIYDEELLPSRISSPSWFSPDNAPKGCGALQAEVYYSSFSPRKDTLETIEQRCIQDMIRMGLFEGQDILATDVREHPYANVMFTPGIYRNRDIVRSYFAQQGIDCAGRFGEWDYLWVGQSLKSGFNAAEGILRQTEG